jgi:hypothetical protein
LKPVPLSVRAAQALLIVPLGVFQGAAALFFSLTISITPGDYLVGAWAVVMATADVAAGVRLSTGAPRWRLVTLVLLGAQIAFALVKLLVYHESASLVFSAFIAVTLACLATPAARRFFAAVPPVSV